MPTIIKTKNSVTAASAPSSLQQGEVAINITDKKVWVGNAATTPVQIVGDGLNGSFVNLAYSGTLTGGTGVVNLGSGQFVKSSSGQISIGTATPISGFPLTVFDSVNGGIVLQNGSGYSALAQNGSDLFLDQNRISSAGNFIYRAGSTLSEFFRISSNGNVGINNNNPAQRLSVIGTEPFSAITSYGTNIFRDVSTTGQELHIRPLAGKNGFISFTENTVADKWVFGIETGSTSLLFKSGSATSNTLRMQLNADGNLGVGAVPIGAGLTVSGGSASIYLTDTVGTPNTWRILAKTGTTSLFRIFDNTQSLDRLSIDTSGNLGFNSGYGSVATAYGVRAWVNFNGQGTVAIRGSGNVSSITDLGTGSYRVNFTNAMPDVNYGVAGMGNRATNANIICVDDTTAINTNDITIYTGSAHAAGTSGGVAIDESRVYVSIIR
jgi:hypothetical protein